MFRPRVSLWVPLLVVNAVVLVFCFLGLHSRDSDTYYHLAGGRWMAEHGQILDQETFSFTIEGRPWTNYYWAFQGLVYGAFWLGGLLGVVAIRGAFMLATASLFVVWIHRRTAGTLLETLAFSLLFVVLAVPRSLNVRPHLASYLLMLVALILLDNFRESRRPAAGFGLVLVCVALANLHGVQYPVMLSMVALFAAHALAPDLNRPLAELVHDSKARSWVLLVAACAGAFLVNPFGVRLLLTPAIGMEREVMGQIAEMQPPSFDAPLLPALDLAASGATLFLALALLGATLLPGWIRRRELLPMGFFILGLGLALTKRRFFVEFLILAVPYMAAGVARLRRESPHWRVPLRSALVAMVVFVLGAAAVSARAGLREGAFRLESNSVEPAGPVAFLARERLGGQLLCDPAYAGYVTWYLGPRVKILADMRTPEPFGAQEIWLSKALGTTLPLRSVSSRIQIDLVIASRASPLARNLRADPESGFSVVHADPWFLTFAHQRVLAGRPLALEFLPLLELIEANPVVELAAPPGFREEAERLAAFPPTNALAERALLWLLLAEGRPQDAITRSRALEQLAPWEETFPFFRGLAASRLDDPGQAVEAFRRSVELAPDRTIASPRLAEALSRLGQDESAAQTMEAFAWKHWPTLGAADYVLLGDLRQRTHQHAEAIQAYERALWLLSDRAGVRAAVAHSMALSHLALGQPERALNLLQPLSDAQPGDPLVALNRARALRLLGRTAEADLGLDALLRDPALSPQLREAVIAARQR